MNFCRLMLVYEHLPTVWKCKAGGLWNMCNWNSTALYCDHVKNVLYILMLVMVMWKCWWPNCFLNHILSGDSNWGASIRKAQGCPPIYRGFWGRQMSTKTRCPLSTKRALHSLGKCSFHRSYPTSVGTHKSILLAILGLAGLTLSSPVMPCGVILFICP
jgi:hypothetical protein